LHALGKIIENSDGYFERLSRAVGGRADSAGGGVLHRVLTRWRLIIAAQVLDVAVIMAAALLLYPLSGGAIAHLPARFVYGAGAAAVLCHFVFLQGRLYEIAALQDETAAIRGILLRWTLLFLGLAAAAALARVPDAVSRLWFFGWYGAGFAGLAAARIIIAMMIRKAIRQGFSIKTVLVIGDNELTGLLIARLAHSRAGIRVDGVFDDRGGAGGFARNVPRRGGIAALLEYSTKYPPDLVVITIPIAASERINAVIRQLRQQPLNIRLLPGRIGLDPVSPISLSRADLPGVQLLAVADRPISELALFAKGCVDRALALVLLLLTAPVLLVCAAGIVLSSPGPVLFRQARVGFRGEIFEILKFRTMAPAAGPSSHSTARQDARVFRFGRWLRQASLDELPQLINVVKGDMSLVGPRPHMVGQRVEGRDFFDAVAEYAGRHRVKPGITGWAQVNGWRGPAETLLQIERRVEHDIYYIENWSFMLDFLILMKTFFVGFFGNNAF
jgi:Undecaprenyl-phosphate glucose phosphotransferase